MPGCVPGKAGLKILLWSEFLLLVCSRYKGQANLGNQPNETSESKQLEQVHSSSPTAAHVPGVHSSLLKQFATILSNSNGSCLLDVAVCKV